MAAGGTAAVSLDNPAQFGRITAVVVNADASRAGFDSQAGDWTFTKDAQGVTLAVVAPGAPVVSTGPPSLVTDHAGFISGDVDPHLLDTTASFEYGLTTAYGSTTPAQAIPGSSVNSTRVTAPLADLKANTTYHYRLVATNSAGTTQGADMILTTARDVTKPVVSFVVKRQKLKTVRTRGFFYLGRCSERCLGSAQLRVTRALARKLRTSTLLGKSRIALDPKTQSVTLRIGVTKRAKKMLAKVKKGFTATVKISVADEAGNLVGVSRRVKLSR
jgi:hypothetical protein